MPGKMETRDADAIESSAGVCKLCLKNKSAYTCPRCNIQYCSVECYKCEGHAQCSENFYKDCFMEGLQDMRSSDEDKRKVAEMLKRVEEQGDGLDSDDDEDDEEGELVERLEGVNLDDTGALWKRLTDSEKRDFQQMLDDGRLGNLIELWEPWWNKSQQDPLVQEMSEEPLRTKVPKILKNTMSIDDMLNKKPPSPKIPYSVINVLYGYAFVCRLHNGGHHQTAADAIEVLVKTSEGLGTGVFDSCSDALHSCLRCCERQGKTSTRDFQVAILHDLKLILAGCSSSPLQYVMAALSDTHALFTKARRSSKDKDGACKNGASVSGFSRYKKKVEFLLSWTHKFGLCLSSIIPEVEVEICSLTSELARHQSDKKKLEDAWGGSRPPRKMSRFVEEIS